MYVCMNEESAVCKLALKLRQTFICSNQTQRCLLFSLHFLVRDIWLNANIYLALSNCVLYVQYLYTFYIYLGSIYIVSDGPGLWNRIFGAQKSMREMSWTRLLGANIWEKMKKSLVQLTQGHFQNSKPEFWNPSPSRIAIYFISI